MDIGSGVRVRICGIGGRWKAAYFACKLFGLLRALRVLCKAVVDLLTRNNAPPFGHG